MSMTPETIGLTITVLGIITGAVWWMAALYHRVGTLLEQTRHLKAVWISEMGGVTDSGEYVPGNQKVARQQMRSELEEKIRKLSERVTALEYAPD